MSIASILLIAGAAVQASEFDVGAGVEGVAAVSSDTAGLGLRQVEVDARLGLGSLSFRLDLDAVATPMTFESGLWVNPQVSPEWAAVLLPAGRGWELGGGVRPLHSAGEAVDGWNNPFTPYTASFASRFPGGLLGGWAAREGEARVRAWGGVQTGPGVKPDVERAVVGGGLGLGRGSLTGDLDLSILPLQQYAVMTGSITADLGEPATITGATWVTGWPDAMQASLIGTVVGLPTKPLSPVGRVEWAPGQAPSDWLLDAGVRWRPQSFVQLNASARFAGDSFAAFAGLSFFEDPEALR